MAPLLLALARISGKQGMFSGQRIILDEVDSTNKHAAAMADLSQLLHGAVILAHAQTAGRGQRGRAWHSQPGLDLTCSVALFPAELRASDQFRITMAASLAVADTVKDLGARHIKVKWPNDVLADDRKIAGILIETALVGERLQQAIVGIGLNVNSDGVVEGARATSLRMETGRHWEPLEVMERVVGRLEQRWEQVVQGDQRLREDYLGGLWGLRRWMDLELDGTPVQARPLDIDKEGRLFVERPDGGVGAYGLDRLRFAPFQG